MRKMHVPAYCPRDDGVHPLENRKSKIEVWKDMDDMDDMDILSSVEVGMLVELISTGIVIVLWSMVAVTDEIVELAIALTDEEDGCFKGSEDVRYSVAEDSGLHLLFFCLHQPHQPTRG
jgi:hypothetical protein